MPPLDKATIKANKEQIRDRHQHDRLYDVPRRGLDLARELPDALWWDEAQITGGGIKGRLLVAVRFDLADGSALDLKTTAESAFVELPEDVGHAVAYLTKASAEEPAG